MKSRILVVDNEEIIGRVLCRALVGYEVSTVTSGREGLERVALGERFDAVICDLHMPEMNGIEFAARLALIAPGLAERILFLTGDGNATRELPDRNVLGKPFETRVLRSRVEQLVRRSVASGQPQAANARS